MISPEVQRKILENYVLPLFSGAKITEDKKPSSAQTQLVATAGNSLMIKFNRNNPERFTIKRSQPFTSKDSGFVLVMHNCDCLCR